MNRRPNPQGKGLVPVLDSLAEGRAHVAVPPKQIDQISNELFTSLFVLHSRFQFKPVVGRRYWLYRREDAFHLSMIAPREWAGAFGQPVGECVLHDDITWTLELDAEAAGDPELLGLIDRKRREFEHTLHSADSLDQALPVYLGALPFYQRVFAAGLANSLRASMRKSGIEALSYSQARGLLGSD
jgi:hypothetical protein